MPDTKHLQFLLLACDLRGRAMEMLIRTANMDDAEARQMIGAVVAGYEKLAQRLEIKSGRADRA